MALSHKQKDRRIADPRGHIEWISVQEASVRLGVSESSVRRWLAGEK